MSVLFSQKLTVLSHLPRALSPDFTTELPDRRRYLAWAKDRTTQPGSGSSGMPEISESIKEKYASLLELTQRVGQCQKGVFAALMTLP